MKILIINLLYIGDLLFSTPVFRALHVAYPEAQLDVLVRSTNLELVRHHPLLTNIIPFDRKADARVDRYVRMLCDIRRERYDLVLNLHASELPSGLAAFSGAGQRVGVSVPVLRALFHVCVTERTDIHQVDAILDVLRCLGIDAPMHRGMEFWLDDATRQSADTRWHSAVPDDGRPAIGLNVGGSWPTKRWTVEGYAAFADMLATRGYHAVFFGGPTDLPMVQDITERMTTRPVVFTGKITLPELAAMTGRCAVFVSGDSGPMHIAASQGVPVVAIFGPSNALRYAPYGVPHVLVRSTESCLGCGQHACDHHRCMRTITAEQVLDALMTLLESPVDDAYKSQAKQGHAIDAIPSSSS